ncbi:MAG TPA: ABC transporter ATP-binding protein [Streptosporangiaceae bacterium]|jgi:peptide/nickel transport system ATP-binding protein
MSVLDLIDVEVTYERSDGSPVRAVAGVSLSVDAGEIVGLVGETGCGKSSLARAACGLLPVSAGAVQFEGRPVRPVRQRERAAEDIGLQMVFQNPYGSLNPRRRVGDQIADGLRRARPAAGPAPTVDGLLSRVGLGPDTARRFPYQLSGGQRQRIALARALAARPSVIVLDEPLSALDVSVQAQVANLLRELARDLGVGMLLISHDLAIVRQIAARTAVMYLGRVVETAPTAGLWSEPAHPYSAALIGAIPTVNSVGQLPAALSGEVPDPASPPPGCRFHPRCPEVMDRCRSEDPVAFRPQADRIVACWLAEDSSTLAPDSARTSEHPQ